MDATESALTAATFERDIAELLGELSATQQDLLAVLGEKRRLLVAGDLPSLAALEPSEKELLARLEGCVTRRQELLERAAAHGARADSIRSLASPTGKTSPLARDLDTAARNTRLLQHQSLTNWVLAQRSLIHLAQLLEIIATGGRVVPTYGKGTPSASGSLVDQAV
jgi:hypothetical protein